MRACSSSSATHPSIPHSPPPAGLFACRRSPPSPGHAYVLRSIYTHLPNALSCSSFPKGWLLSRTAACGGGKNQVRRYERATSRVFSPTNMRMNRWFIWQLTKAYSTTRLNYSRAGQSNTAPWGETSGRNLLGKIPIRQVLTDSIRY